ncbi:MAG TPA: TetR/AcrR family transcriptional regulator [Caulobacterales bacterium]|nr:TetR/AcrR family transcriptional regulator [Caulobacterales bacterium]
MTLQRETAEMPSARQREVLEAALRLLVRGGGKLTMSALAAEANCSKETVYKWFGDRDGLLSAIVRWQAAQVRVEALDEDGIDRLALIARLKQFASDWLRVVSSDKSLALNRLAIGHAGEEGGELGAIVLDNGRFALGRRLKPVLEAARAAGLIQFESAEEAFRTFFGLIARDVHIRLLLGDRLRLDRGAIAKEAARAADQFMALYGIGRRSKT